VQTSNIGCGESKTRIELIENYLAFIGCDVIIAVEVDADRVNDDKYWMASLILGKSQWTRMDMWCSEVSWMNSRRQAWFDPDGPTTVKSTKVKCIGSVDVNPDDT
jgi:hypothetical protein